MSQVRNQSTLPISAKEKADRGMRNGLLITQETENYFAPTSDGRVSSFPLA
jgi:hypothetical protein